MISKKQKWKRKDTDYNLKLNTIKCYTDDFKTNTGVGAGIYGSRIVVPV